MAARRKSSGRKYGKAASKRVEAAPRPPVPPASTISLPRSASGKLGLLLLDGNIAAPRHESAMRRRKKGTLRSGRSGRKVTSRKQAIAIGLSEAREKGAKVPRKKGSSRKSSGRKSSGRKSSGRKSSRKKSS